MGSLDQGIDPTINGINNHGPCSKTGYDHGISLPPHLNATSSAAAFAGREKSGSAFDLFDNTAFNKSMTAGPFNKNMVGVVDFESSSRPIYPASTPNLHRKA